MHIKSHTCEVCDQDLKSL